MNVSVVISTYNRCGLLGKTIASVLAQEASTPAYELIVVDNNSTDNTRQVIESFVAQDSRVRYVFEQRQGLSFGRNAGLAAAQGEFIIYTDDDVVVAPNWVRKFHEAFLRHPDADFLGGKVLPLWERKPEPWLTPNLSPLALQDMGEEPVKVSFAYQRCLIGACLGIRRTAFDKAGLFDTATQRVGDAVGSTEDHDWELSVWQNGGYGMYVPDVVCWAEVPAGRMVKSYHRRWHLGHGKFNAIARRSEYEGGAFRFLDVPAFMYRLAGESALQCLGSLMQGKFTQAFHKENLLFFYLGFIRERWKQQLLGRGKTLPPPSATSARSAGRS